MMHRLTGWVLFLSAAIAVAQAGAPSPSYKLGAVTQDQSATDALVRWGSYWGTTKVSGARYLGFHNSAGPEIGTYGKDGKTTQFYVTMEGAGKVSVYDAVHEPDGKVIASGWAATQNGQFANYIAQIAPTGEISQVVRTGAFAPYKVCAVEDGLVWALGMEADFEKASSGPGSYPMLRQFSFRKGIVRTGMPRSLGTTKPLMPYFSLACNSTSATAYFPETGQILRFTFSDGITRHWNTDLVRTDSIELLDLAVADDGSIFATVQRNSSGSRLGGLFHCKLDPLQDKANWMPVADSGGSLIAGPRTRLVSASGGELMLVRGIGAERKAYVGGLK